MNVADYPLTPLDVMPLHAGAGDFFSNVYYACMDEDYDYHPDQVLYDWRCPECLMAAKSNVWAYGDNEQLWRPKVGDEPIKVMLSWLISRAVCWSG